MSDESALRVFIGYRRQDSAGHAGRLHDALCARLPSVEVFMDVGGIEPGVDFTRAIAEAVGDCDVMLALIGFRWATAETTEGLRRLDDPDDHVVAEIAAALERDIRVIPVLIDGAAMPLASDLPERIKGLARRNAVTLDTVSWPADLDALLSTLGRLARLRTPAQLGGPTSVASDHIVATTATPGRPVAWLSRQPKWAVLAVMAAAVASLIGGLAWRSADQPGRAEGLQPAVEPAAPSLTTTKSQIDATTTVPSCYKETFKSIPTVRQKVINVGIREFDFRPGDPISAPVSLVLVEREKTLGAVGFTYLADNSLKRIDAVVEGEKCRPVVGYRNAETKKPSDAYTDYEDICLPLNGTTYQLGFVPGTDFFRLTLEQVAC